MRGEGIVPVMEVGNNGSGFGNGFGNNGDWAWIIILFLIFGNGRGFGNWFGGNGNINANVKSAREEECDERDYSLRVKLAPLSVSIFKMVSDIKL